MEVVRCFLPGPQGTSLSNVPLSKPVRGSPGQKEVPAQQGARLDGQSPPHLSPPAFQ